MPVDVNGRRKFPDGHGVSPLSCAKRAPSRANHSGNHGNRAHLRVSCAGRPSSVRCITFLRCAGRSTRRALCWPLYRDKGSLERNAVIKQSGFQRKGASEFCAQDSPLATHSRRPFVWRFHYMRHAPRCKVRTFLCAAHILVTGWRQARFAVSKSANGADARQACPLRRPGCSNFLSALHPRA